jgi:arginyl-tRNA synthetase
MSNTIGESLSRIIENEGADIKRLSYGGDVGLHTAKSIFAVQNRKGDVSEVQTKSKKEQVAFWAECYVAGSTAYLDDPIAKNEIDNLNKIIFDKDDAEINELYDWGREVSIYHFQEMFKRLDSHFYRNFWESEVIGEAMKAVNDGLNRKILEHSEGAVIFRGEDHGLHTRVFVNSKGVPTYEAKELGLGVEKYKLFHFDQSVVITGNEQNEYFKVVLRAMELLLPEVAGKTVHVGHGMLRLPEGKMSSRKGNVIVAEDLLNMVVAKVQDKMKDRDMTEDEKEKISEMIAIGAVRYSILRQAPGKDIAFDFDTSISFEGDSGPYLQYSVVRARSAVQKSTTDTASTVPDLHSWQTTGLEKQIEKYPRVVARAGEEFAPQYITTYLTELAGEFNSFYAHHKINDDADPLSSYKLAITKAFIAVMTHGLHLLGIKVPERM